MVPPTFIHPPAPGWVGRGKEGAPSVRHSVRPSIICMLIVSFPRTNMRGKTEARDGEEEEGNGRTEEHEGRETTLSIIPSPPSVTAAAFELGITRAAFNRVCRKRT